MGLPGPGGYTPSPGELGGIQDGANTGTLDKDKARRETQENAVKNALKSGIHCRVVSCDDPQCDECHERFGMYAVFWKTGGGADINIHSVARSGCGGTGWHSANDGGGVHDAEIGQNPEDFLKKWRERQSPGQSFDYFIFCLCCKKL
jgi:hypothetical protein